MQKQTILTLIALFVFAGCASTLPNERKQPPSLFGMLFGSDEQPKSTLGNMEAPKEDSKLQLPIPNFNQAQTPVFAGMFNLQNVDGNVWRTGLDAVNTFQLVSRIISQNYIVVTSDRRGMALNTDWDKFFIEGRLFRNRISLTVFPVGPRQTEIVIKNTVEYYSGNPNKPEEAMVSQWLPSPDVTDEVARIVDATNKQTASFVQSRLRTR